jgi:uncharacterized protein (DUF2132 family)
MAGHGSLVCGAELELPNAQSLLTFFKRTMAKSSDPLHGITLERLLTELVEHVGWEEMGRQVPVRCFLHDPSVKSSLTFLRRTPWARARVEALYVNWKRAAGSSNVASS